MPTVDRVPHDSTVQGVKVVAGRLLESLCLVQTLHEVEEEDLFIRQLRREALPLAG